MYTLKSHPVEVSRITGLQPLLGRNDQLTSPDVALILVLENGQKQKWLCEKNASAPAPSDWFVTDKELGVTFVVPAQKFGELFQESKG